MKLRIALVFFIVYCLSFIISPVHAQFWHVLPSVGKGDEVAAGFSNDEKKIFYLNTKDGVGNVWSMVIMDKYGGIIAGPKNPPVQITKFTDHGIVRFFHLLNRPEFVFMRATENGKDFHIYRMKDDGSEQPQDLTPGGEGITSEIIGASYNGRYVYYTNNAVHHDKVDVYRYDTQQFTSDLIFPNDKDYRVLAWTHDQNKLLIEDSNAHSLSYYNIETTQKTLVGSTDGEIMNAEYGPSGLKVSELVLKTGGAKSTPKDSYAAAMNAVFSVDYSPNGKFEITHEGGKWLVGVIATNTPLMLPEGARLLAIAPKETLLVYEDSSKLYLYDIAKNKSTELTLVQ
jgi:hypothetical protein